MNRWAIVNPTTNVVENVVIWEGGGDPWAPFIAIQLNPAEPCAPFYTYDANATPRFIEPAPPPEPTP